MGPSTWPCRSSPRRRPRRTILSSASACGPISSPRLLPLFTDMRSKTDFHCFFLCRPLLLAIGWLLAGSGAGHAAEKEKKSWWNTEWTIRKKITIDASAAGGNLTEPVGAAAVVLLRLSDSNFQFEAEGAHDDGSGLRFVAD